MDKRADKDLGRAVAAKTKPSAANLKQARGSRLEHAEAAAGADPKFGHPPNPAGFAGHFRDIRPVAGSQHVQGQQVVIQAFGSR